MEHLWHNMTENDESITKNVVDLLSSASNPPVAAALVMTLTSWNQNFADQFPSARAKLTRINIYRLPVELSER